MIPPPSPSPETHEALILRAEALLKAITAGDWTVGVDGNPRVYGPDNAGAHSGLLANVFKGRGNAEFIAAAPQLVRDLLAALSRPSAVTTSEVQEQEEDTRVDGERRAAGPTGSTASTD